MHGKQKKNSMLLTVMVAVMLVLSLSITAIAAQNLTTTVGVTDLSVSDEGTTAWSASAGRTEWSGTTASEEANCNTTYTPATGKLVLTNNSGIPKYLSFDYTVDLQSGSFKINGSSITSNSNYFALLPSGETVTLEVSSAPKAEKTTKVTLSNITLESEKVTITFAAPTNGSYTVNGTAITANTSVTNPNTDNYKLVATPASGYFLEGWYLGDTKLSENAEDTLAFTTGGTVTANFQPLYKSDPLYREATVPSGSKFTKDELVSINSSYFHDASSHLVPDGGFPVDNSAYSKEAQSQVKDKIDVQYVPSLVWSRNMSIGYSGTARGDYVTDWKQETFSYARMLSDMIQIYAKESCNISFNYKNSMSGANNTTENTIYYLITTASSANVAQVKAGNKLTGTSGSSGSIALSKGNYLYILAEGYGRDRDYVSTGTMDFSYSASISDFTIEYNEKKDVLTAGFRDNTGKALGSGTVIVNNVGQAIGSNGNMADMSFADQAGVSLSVGAAPANYVHIGWEITPKGGTTTKVYSPTYNRTLTEDVTVNAIFVPKITITMGANGYADATYKDFNGNDLNGQYVARNANCTQYYTSLADAFSKTDTVVLLAGTTINGDWEIPADKTFAIPYGMNDPGSTTPSYAWGMGSWDYCLVNLNGNLTVNGTLVVSAQQNQSTGATGGNPGHLVVSSGKTITVNGAMYAYGPVTGDGSVNATPTAKIHETMEFSDNTVVIYIYNIYNERSSKKVFPYNTMFINSIEIPVTYQLGATLTGHMAIRYDDICNPEIPIIAGSGAMINHTAGTITKYYDRSTGQFVFRFNEGSVAGTGAFSISMNVTVGTFSEEITLNTRDFYIPLAAPYRYEVAGNLTINDKYKCLPGMVMDVKESGVLTIAEAGEMVFYRRNDFDNRGKHGNSTEPWGYTEVAYPQNPQRYNSASYPFSFDNANMGSAKLNVDGKLIVNGGLYVTDELHNDIAPTDNGYNFLTGKGSIDMRNAKTNRTTISEAMRASGTNDLAWDTTEVVPMKGLKADATANSPENYESLTGQVKGSINGSNLNVWSEDPCANGHTPGEAADCENAQTCTICGAELAAALGHKWINADCDTPKTCSVCGATEGEALGHTPGQAADCLNAQTCTVCGTELAAANGHSYNNVTTDPTCTSNGYTTYTCGTCGDTYVSDNVAALGHTPGQAADCLNAQTCTICGVELVAAKGHSMTHTPANAATCLKTGNNDYWTCNTCNKVYADANGATETSVEDQTLPENSNHESSELVWTITEDQHSAIHKCCEASAVALETHKDENDDNLCDSCKKELHTHSYNADVTAPNCVNGGYTTYTCACGESYVADEVAALGHSYESVVTEPDYNNQGYTTHTCANCGDEYVDSYVDALPAAASVNDSNYGSFAEAFAAANPGETVQLFAPVVVAKGETLELNKAVTIAYTSDITGEAMFTNNGTMVIQDADIIYTYTGAADTAYSKGNYTIANSGSLTITSGSVLNATAKMSHASYAITNGNGGQITLNGGRIENTTNYAVRMFGEGSLTVNSGEIVGTRAVWMQAPGSSATAAPTIALTVNGGKLTGTGEGNYKLAVYSYSYGNSLENVSIAVSGGEFDGDIALSGGKNKNVAEKVTVTGGTITDLYSYADDEVAAKGIQVSGGTFRNAVAEAYCAEGFIPTANDDGTYGVKEGCYVAQNLATLTKYENLAEAVAAAQEAETVALLTDITLEAPVIAIGKTVDLNGFTLNGNLMGTLKVNGGTMVTSDKINMISGEGEYKYHTTDAIVEIDQYGGVRFLSGTVEVGMDWRTLPNQILFIEEDATFIIPKGKSFQVRGNATLKGSLVNNGTLEIYDGGSVTGNVAGTIKMTGGILITAEGYRMIGKNADYYQSSDAVFSMNAQGQITVHSGEITLVPDEWWTLVGQELTIGKDATFVIPADKTLQVLSTVIVEGTAVVDGTVNLYVAEATVQGPAGIVNIKTTAGETVWYNNGTYVVHNHTEVVDAAVDPDCTNTGLTEGKHCSVCGQVKIAQETVPALDHSFTKYESDNNATFENDGTKTAKCDRCGATDTIIEEGTQKIAVAQIGEKKYETLAEAVAAAQSKETVKILKDIVLTETVVVNKDQEITLDLNGKTVSMEDASGTTAVLLKNNGTLTIQDSVGEGKLSFCSSTPSTDNAYASNTISNYGMLTVKSGTVENNSIGGACYALDNYAGSTATIDGGLLTAKKTAVRVFTWTDGTNTVLNVNDGTILSESGYGINFNMGNTPGAELNITGGTITTQDTQYNLAVYVVNKKSAENVSIRVSGGTFNGSFALNGVTSSTMAEGAVSVSGGTFKSVICYAEPAYDFVSGGRFSEEIDATFLENGYCAKLNEGFYEIDKHDYKDVVTEPTCTTLGYTTHTCSRCRDSYKDNYTETVAHSYEEVVTPPTCTTGGYTTYTCSCGHSYTGNEADMLDHTEETIPAVDATCTATGLTAGVKCSVCETVLVEQEETAKIPHTKETVPGKAADCLNAGLTAGEKCSVCGETITAQTEIPALGHTEETVPGKDATCKEPGLTDGIKCSVCGETITAQTEISTLAHTEEIIPAVPATCTATGLTDGIKCSVCQDVLVEQEETSMIPHTEQIVSGTAATCNNTGLTEGTKCSVCGQTTKPQEEIPALGHDIVEDTGYAATCESTGLTEGEHCSRCDHKVAQTEIPATGHNWVDGVCQNDNDHECSGHEYVDGVCKICKYGCSHEGADAEVKDPTCTEAGYTTHSCDVCKHTWITDNVDAKGHDWEDATCTTPKTCNVCSTTEGKENGHNYSAEVTAPTCTAEGYTTYTCSSCDHSYTADKIAAKGHVNGATVVENEVPATCTAEGSYENVVHCTVCEAEVSREKVTTSKAAHNYTEKVTEPTCTEQGYTTHTCNSCGYNYVDNYTVASGHSYGDWTVTEATCTEKGSRTKTCTCGDVVTEEIAATGHSYSTEVTDPTCTAKGYTTYTCGTCNHSYKDDEVDALPHTPGAVVVENEKAATCTEDGSYQNVTYCTVCNKETRRETVSVASQGHKYQPKVTAPTCTNAGYTTYTCSGCDDTYTADTVDKLGHKFGEWETGTEPTCTDVGQKKRVCSVCNEPEFEVIPATGHVNTTTTRVEPTCGQAGSETVTCDCGEVVSSKVLPATGNHSWKEATYDAPKNCSVCGKTEGSKVPRPAVEVVPPKDVTTTKPEGSDINADETKGVVDTVVSDAKNLTQPETGINAEGNAESLDAAKNEIPDETAKTYETSLIITLTAVEVDKEEGAVVAKKVTFDVSPMLYALNELGIKVGETKVKEFAEEITFRLPVDCSTKAAKAKVWHENDVLGFYEIQNDGENKYVEVKSKNFSNFSVMPVNTETCEHTWNNGVCVNCETTCSHAWSNGTCTICQSVCEHTFSGAVCSNCGFANLYVTFKQYNLELGNSLAMIFWVNKDTIQENVSYEAEIVRTRAGVVSETVYIPMADWSISADGTCYTIKYDDIAAKEMTDNVTIRIVTSDNAVVSKSYTLSIRSYAMKAIDIYKSYADYSELVTAMVDMLNYGAAAQMDFDYQNNDLANNQLTAEHQAFASPDYTPNNAWTNPDKIGYSCNLELVDNIVLNVWFKGIQEGMYAEVSFKNHMGNTVTDIVTFDEFTSREEYTGIDGVYSIPAKKLVVADGNQTVTYTVYNSDGTVYGSCTQSIEGLVYAAIKNNLDKNGLYDQILKFTRSSYNYFH